MQAYKKWQIAYEITKKTYIETIEKILTPDGVERQIYILEGKIKKAVKESKNDENN